MTRKRKTDNSIKVGKFTVTREPGTLTIICNPDGETTAVGGPEMVFYGTNLGEKTSDARTVKAIASAISATMFDRYTHQIEGKLYLHDAPAVIEDSMKDNNTGYIIGELLSEWRDQGKVGRTREITPHEWYRLGWNGVRYFSQDVTYQEYEEGEYEGVGGPKHNRNALRMLDGFNLLNKASRKGVNITLRWCADLDEYMNKVLTNVELINEGKVEEATENYRAGAATAKARGTMARVKHGETKSVFKGIVLVLKGTEVTETELATLIGKSTMVMVEGNGVDKGITLPFTYDLETMDDLTDFGEFYARQRKPRLIVN